MSQNPGIANAFSGPVTITGAVQIENAATAIINPATEDTLLKTVGLGILQYDYLSAAYPDAVTEVYTLKTGGSGGATVATLTVVYTNSSKTFISTLTKT